MRRRGLTPMAAPNPDEQPSLALLVNVHADDSEPWDWHRIAAQPPPREPAFANEYERTARATLDSYKPNIIERLTGAAERRRTELEQAVSQGASADVMEYSAAVAKHREALHRWTTVTQLAPRVLRLEETACRAALRFALVFRDIPSLRGPVNLDSIRDGVASLSCVVDDDPDRSSPLERSVLSHVMLSTEHIGPNPLYQDRACSIAIRIARETFSVLPIAHAVVNLVAEQRDPATGELVPDTILAIRFSVEALSSITSYGLLPMPRRVKSTHTPGLGLRTATGSGAMPGLRHGDAAPSDSWDDDLTPPLWENATIKRAPHR